MSDPVEQRFKDLRDRQVGFELFDSKRAENIPHKSYVARSGRFVLIGFNDLEQAGKFFDSAIEATL